MRDEHLGMRQQDFCDAAGVSQSFLSGWLARRVKTTPRMLIWLGA